MKTKNVDDDSANSIRFVQLNQKSKKKSKPACKSGTGPGQKQNNKQHKLRYDIKRNTR